MLNYLEGDATDPVGDGNKIIVHCCNDIGAMGSGFVIPLAQRYPTAKARYLKAFEDGTPQLGDVIWAIGSGRVFDNNEVWIANLIGQHGVKGRTSDGQVPIRYDAVNVGFREIAQVIAEDYTASIHMPRMGAGLAGGDWRVIEALIKSNFTDAGIDVYVYDLPGQPFKGKQ